MNLHDYLNSPNSLTVAELATAIEIKSPAQIRQWQHAYANRLPGPENCVAMERATKGAIKRWDLRPADWFLIWPELIRTKGSPAIPDKQES